MHWSPRRASHLGQEKLINCNLVLGSCLGIELYMDYWFVRHHTGTGGRVGGSLYGEVKVNKFEYVWGAGGGPCMLREGGPHVTCDWLVVMVTWGPLFGQTYKREWKHYIPATSLVGGRNTNHWCPNYEWSPWSHLPQDPDRDIWDTYSVPCRW